MPAPGLGVSFDSFGHIWHASRHVSRPRLTSLDLIFCVMTSPTPSEEALRRARERGREDAERFVLGLDLTERREREERLAKMAWKVRSEAGEPWASEEAAAEIARLRTRVEALAGYVRSVEGSTPWRAIQWLRRLVGRAW